MPLNIQKLIISKTKAVSCHEIAVLQNLWSGYGSIVRYGLEGATAKSVIVKHIQPVSAVQHPRGWNTDRSHLRKLNSYQVESKWYQDYAKLCDKDCRVPECFAVQREGDEILILLEDLDTSGFPERLTSVNPVEMHACLGWLAAFHANFLGNSADGLWDCGTYWHLATRPDELERLATEDPYLYAAAETIDAKLRASPFQTLVHGDAKLANFCFSADGASVAAVDFQYVGRGCGIKDVAYFIGSCLDEVQCEQQSPALLDFYFNSLRTALIKRQSPVDLDALENDWRALYPLAWTDFHRFLKGWSPGHWKIHSYSERIAQEVISTSLKK